MRRYLIRRVAQLVPVLLGISLVTFLIVRLAPGDPAAMLVDTTLVSPAELARFRAQLGLDAPWPVQFVALLKQLITGEIHSLRTGQPVLTMLADRLPITAALLGGAIVLSLLLGVPMGVLSARKPYGHLDNWLSIAALGGVSLPGFWFALVLMWVFAGILHVLPATGTAPTSRLTYTALDMAPYFVMPTVVLASGLLPSIMRYTRSSMLDALSQDYVRTARSKGLSESLVLYRHALRNALLPVVTVVGLLVPVLIGSTAVIESVFAMPGIGRLVVEAAINRDYPTILTLNLLTAAAVLISTLVVDILYAVLDPRIELP
jgi:peptide/nickel transport system permease protein